MSEPERPLREELIKMIEEPTLNGRTLRVVVEDAYMPCTNSDGTNPYVIDPFTPLGKKVMTMSNREQNMTVIYDWYDAMDEAGRGGQCRGIEESILVAGGYNADSLNCLPDECIEYLAQNLHWPEEEGKKDE